MFVIGDVHGHLDLLKGLYSNLPLKADDIVYCVGDLTDRGCENIGVINFVREKGIKVCKGNHEEMLIKALSEEGSFNYVMWLKNGGMETLYEFEPLSSNRLSDIVGYLKSLPMYFKDGDVVIYHAGVSDKKYKDIEECLKKESGLHDFLWWREDYIENDYMKNYDNLFVSGHTPTYCIDKDSYGKVIKMGNRLFIDVGNYNSGVLAAVEISGKSIIAHYFNNSGKYSSEKIE